MKSITIKSKELVEFGSTVRERRRALGVTLEELAEKADRSDREIRDIELGKVEPLFMTALRVCDACEIDVGELKEFVPEKNTVNV